MQLFPKILSGMANSADLVFVRNLGIQNSRAFTISDRQNDSMKTEIAKKQCLSDTHC